MRRALQALGSTSWSSLVRFHDLLVSLTWRDIRVRYKQSVLGIAWAVLLPLSMMLVFTFVFTRAIDARQVLSVDMPYALYAYSGLVPWTFFSAGLGGCVTSLVANRNLVTKVYFPREVFPVACIAGAFVDFCVAMTVLFGLIGYFQWTGAWRFDPTPALAFVPIVIVVQVTLTVGLGMMLAMANLFYRDVRQVFGVAIQLAMFVSAVVVPVPADGSLLARVIGVNPLVPIIGAYRDCIMFGRLPDMTAFSYSAVVAAIAAVAGVGCFRRVHLMSETMVQFERVCKRFRLGESHDSLRDLISACVRHLFGGGRVSSRESFWAVRDVDFTVRRGESVGVIGPNGAGKSTVLKLLSNVLRPDAGRIRVRGRLAALIEVGAGFHGDLTGRENIFLNGAILGMSRAEIRAKLDAIVGFAGLERFIDTPVKRYSSGMYARLGFSIASHVEPDVLLVDEVLSVGDAVFRLRCMDRMRRLVRDGTTLVFVTHDLDQMQSICPRAIVLEHGCVAFAGPSSEAVAAYMQAMSRSYARRGLEIGSDQRDAPVVVDGVTLTDASDRPVVWARPHQKLCVALSFTLRRVVPRLVVELNMRASVAENLVSVNSGRDDTYFEGRPGRHTVRLEFPALHVAGGQYLWNVRLWDGDTGAALVDTPFRYPLVINDGGGATGALSLAHDWSHVGPARTIDALGAAADTSGAVSPNVTGVSQ